MLKKPQVYIHYNSDEMPKYKLYKEIRYTHERKE